MSLPKHATYLRELFSLKLISGEGDASGSYDIRRVGDRFDYELTDGALTLGDLTMEAISGSVGSQSLNTLNLQGVSWASAERALSIDHVEMGEGCVELVRKASNLSWLEIPIWESNSAGIVSGAGSGFRTALLRNISINALELSIADVVAGADFDQGIDLDTMTM